MRGQIPRTSERPRLWSKLVSELSWRWTPVYAWLLAATLCTALLLGQYYRPTLTIPVYSDIQAFQIYRYAEGIGYTEANSSVYRSHVEITPDGPVLDLRIPAHPRFRLDFLGSGTVRLAGTVIKKDNSLLTQQSTTYLLDPKQMTTHGLVADGLNYLFREADDPYIDIPLAALPVARVESTVSVFPLLVVAAVFGLALLLYRIRDRIAANAVLALAMVAICTFLGMIALTLPYNHGPDEALHCFSGIWYLNHERPPSMADPIHYDPNYGVNYLIGASDLTYWLTFHVTGLLDSFSSLDLFDEARLSQLAIVFFSFLVVLGFAEPCFAWAYLLCFMAVPQVAYAATYVNGDLLSFAMAFAVLSVICSTPRLPGVVVAACLFVLAGLKLNYLILVPVAIYFVYCRYGRKAIGWALAGLAIGSYKLLFTLADSHHLGRSTLANQIMHVSNPTFKTRLLHPYMQWTVLTDSHFYTLTFKSVYGIFGYMTYALPWYDYWVGVILLLAIVVRNRWRENSLISALAAVNLAASLYFSISYDYQPQGRYLFPTVLIVFLISARNITSRAYVLFGIPAVLAIFSFWRFPGRG